MRSPELLDTRDVPLPEIFLEDRLRGLSESGIAGLMASIEQIGLQDEIHLRQVRLKEPYVEGVKTKLVLMAGGHRLEAMFRLGHETIRAKIWDCTNDYARLIEIDDNLAGADLSPLDLAVFLAERKRVYEDMYPETKAATGSELIRKRWDTADTMSVVSFVTSTAEQFGQSERNIRRIVAAAQNLDAETIEALRAAPNQVTLKDLQELAKTGEPKDRAFICKALSEGTAKNAMDAKRQLRIQKNPAAAVPDPHDMQAAKIMDAWSRASKSARHRFVRICADELRALIADVEAEAERNPKVQVGAFKSRQGRTGQGTS